MLYIYAQINIKMFKSNHKNVSSLVFFQTNPILIRIETKAGHGSGKPTAKVVSGFNFIDFVNFNW